MEFFCENEQDPEWCTESAQYFFPENISVVVKGTATICDLDQVGGVLAAARKRFAMKAIPTKFVAHWVELEMTCHDLLPMNDIFSLTWVASEQNERLFGMKQSKKKRLCVPSIPAPFPLTSVDQSSTYETRRNYPHQHTATAKRPSAACHTRVLYKSQHT